MRSPRPHPPARLRPAATIALVIARRFGIVAALLAPLAAATSAPAATVATSQACYRGGELMHATVTGFAPDSFPGFTIAGTPLRSRYVNGSESFLTGDGSIDLLAPDPANRAPSETVQLQAQTSTVDADGMNVFTTATTQLRLVDQFAVRQSPRSPGGGAKVTLRVSGATSLKPLYLHITRASAKTNKVVSRRTINLGKPTGSCGSLTVTMRALGTAHPGSGTYSRTVDEVATKLGDQDPESRRERVNLAVIFVGPRAAR